MDSTLGELEIILVPLSIQLSTRSDRFPRYFATVIAHRGGICIPRLREILRACYLCNVLDPRHMAVTNESITCLNN